MGFFDTLFGTTEKTAASKTGKAVVKKNTEQMLKLVATHEGRSKTVPKSAPNPKLKTVKWGSLIGAEIKSGKYGQSLYLHIQTEQARGCFFLVSIHCEDWTVSYHNILLEVYTTESSFLQFVPTSDKLKDKTTQNSKITFMVYLFSRLNLLWLPRDPDQKYLEDMAACLRGEKKDARFQSINPYENMKSNEIEVANKKIVIVIDPGHGDHNSNNKQIDPGTCSTDNKELEKDYALILSLALKCELLKDERYSIFLTREADITIKKPAVNWRSEIANEKKGDIFISFHLNSGVTNDIFAVYQQSKKNEKESISLGEKITNKLKGSVQLSNKPVRSAVEATRYTTVGVLNQFTGKAAILFEFGGIDSPSNLKNIKENKENISNAIKKGIDDFTHENF